MDPKLPRCLTTYVHSMYKVKICVIAGRTPMHFHLALTNIESETVRSRIMVCKT
jgi:hypothetical protein